MSDAKVTGFRSYLLESVEMTHRHPDHRDIGGKLDTYISRIPLIWGSYAPEVRHPSTLNGLEAKQRHCCVTNPTRMRDIKSREKKSRCAPHQKFQNLSRSHGRGSR